VICRLSSEKKAPDPSGKKTTRERVQENNLRREEEGLILADRLASNCPTPVEFEETWSYCGIRHSSYTTDWAKPASSSSAFVNNIRDLFEGVRDKNVTILVRAPDGITTNKLAMQSFLQFIRRCGITAQLIFQWVKVCDDIRPTVLRNFMGLGGTADFMAQDFLDHLEGTKTFPEVKRMLEVLDSIEDNKGLQQGIQDRNTLPPADLAQAEEVGGLANSAGRKKAKA
jgi:hypothetical protein